MSASVRSFSAVCDTEVYMKSDGRQACAFFLGRGYSWREANSMCSSLGGHLPVIQSAQENKDIYDLQVIGYLKNIFLKDLIHKMDT